MFIGKRLGKFVDWTISGVRSDRQAITAACYIMALAKVLEGLVAKVKESLTERFKSKVGLDTVQFDGIQKPDGTRSCWLTVIPSDKSSIDDKVNALGAYYGVVRSGAGKAGEKAYRDAVERNAVKAGYVKADIDAAVKALGLPVPTERKIELRAYGDADLVDVEANGEGFRLVAEDVPVTA
jgi:hypothetical protein